MNLLRLALACIVSIPAWVQSYELIDKETNSSKTIFTTLIAEDLGFENHIQQPHDFDQWVEGLKDRKCSSHPLPPQLPRNFSWKGRYVVSDLIDPETGKMGINVPFTWNGNDGNIQMIAGSEKHPIYFTNLIFDDHLYTYTYKWPGLQPEFLPPLEPCFPLLEFTLEDLNAFLATSRYVGPKIIEGKKACHHVHHFRVGIVLPQFPSGFYPRFPFSLADIYVDQNDSSKFWQVLHFGLQNIYDPELDEWIFIEKMSSCPGKIKLPPVCLPPSGS